MTSPKRFVETAGEVARQFGFISIEEFFAKTTSKRKPLKSPQKKMDSLELDALSSLLRHAHICNLHQEEEAVPYLIFHDTVEEKNKQALFPLTRKPLPVQFSITILNIDNGFAEALALTCMHRILKETGCGDNPTVRINSVGDTVSFVRFLHSAQRAVTRYEKYIPETYKDLIKKNILQFYSQAALDEDCTELMELMPKPVSFLTRQEQEHFQEVLGYIEEQDFIFKIDEMLVGDADVHSHTVMAIDSAEGVTAHGGRYNTLSRAVIRTAMPAVSISVTLNQESEPKKIRNISRKKAPVAYVVHTGQESRKKALQVIDYLCEKKVCVEHRIHLPTVQEQLDSGEGRDFSYLLVVGHQEVEEGLASLRVRKKNAIERIEFSKIHNRLKKIR